MIKTEVYDYIQKQNLLEKYFLNFSEFNSYNFNLSIDNMEYCSRTLKKNSESSNDLVDYKDSTFGNFNDRNLIKSFDKIEELEEKVDNVGNKELRTNNLQDSTLFDNNL